MQTMNRRQFSRWLAAFPLAAAAFTGCNGLQSERANLASLDGTAAKNAAARADGSAQPRREVVANYPSNIGAKPVDDGHHHHGDGHDHSHGAIQQVGHTTPAATTNPQCIVELRKEGGKPQRVAIPLSQEFHVQDLLEKSGALKKFRRMDLLLARPTPAGNTARMSVGFDRKSRKVDPQNDYCIQPGDLLIVTEDTSTVLDDMFNRKEGSMGKKVARQVVGA